MTRFHATAAGSIPFTAQEEIDRDAEELAASEERVATEKAKITAIAKDAAIEKLLLKDPAYAAALKL